MEKTLINSCFILLIWGKTKGYYFTSVGKLDQKSMHQKSYKIGCNWMSTLRQVSGDVWKES
jgi:hypothetical protein